MSTRIWAGRCEDCYDKQPLNVFRDDSIPEGIKVELCKRCIAMRGAIKGRGGAQPPIGLLESGTWCDAKSIVVVFQDKKRIVVQVKYLKDSDSCGLVRLKFPDQIKWLAGGVFGTTPRLVLSEAQHHLSHSYFPNQPITFEQ